MIVVEVEESRGILAYFEKYKVRARIIQRKGEEVEFRELRWNLRTSCSVFAAMSSYRAQRASML